MKNYTKIMVILLNFLLLAGSFTSCKKSSFENGPAKVSLYQITADDRNFTLFRAAINRAGLQEMFNGKEPLTILAPTNQAFINVGLGSEATINKFTPGFMDSLVRSHIIPGRVDVSAITGSKEVATLNRTATIAKIGNTVYTNGGDITRLNLEATNGLLNVTTKVLVAPVPSILDYLAIPLNTTYTFLVAAINRASQGSTNFAEMLRGNGAYTLFAPTNAAFIDAGFANIAAVSTAAPATLENLLKYHLIEGRKLSSDLDSVPLNTLANVPVYFDRNSTIAYTTNSANGILFNPQMSSPVVTSPNYLAGNGVIHFISRVLPRPVETTTLQQINSNPSLSFLSAAIVRASQGTGDDAFDFTKLLSDPLQLYTFFAPTDAAFQAAGYPDMDAINAETPGTLANLLKYHLIKYRQNSINFTSNNYVSTLFQLSNSATGVKSPAPIVLSRTAALYSVSGEGNTTVGTVSPRDIITTTGILNVVNLVLKPRSE
ncbi:MAG TPA: fasciclin domain-containing protein [Pedobacter sp.]|uniref:fasciclin domain-containing protein n=1 Tax=Pedobacter sp. TaxID=1411316 RepID=UPI002CC57774|nr:fasciclin domain-containing protein [Pedobacter sp.]HMI02104.1 fasciclin domain-containing protein [Pedobacter sp.]